MSLVSCVGVIVPLQMIDLFFQALWILAFFRRSKAIGGPLLVFFVQVFVKPVLSLITIPAVLLAWQQRDRSAPLPFDERMIYIVLLFLVTSFAATTVTAIVALALLKTRRWHYAILMRGGLGILAALAVTALLHHVSISNLLELIFPMAFLPYFFVSKRVKHAFHQPEPIGAPGCNRASSRRDN